MHLGIFQKGRNVSDKYDIKEHPTIAALRAVAMQREIPGANGMTDRELVRWRVHQEWAMFPASHRPARGTEYNTESWRQAFALCGMPTVSADRIIEEITGLKPITKYDHLTDDELWEVWREQMHAPVVRDVKADVDKYVAAKKALTMTSRKK